MKTEVIEEHRPQTENELREEIDKKLRQIKASMRRAAPEKRYYLLLRAHEQLKDKLPEVSPTGDPEDFRQAVLRRKNLEDDYLNWLLACSRQNPEALRQAFQRLAGRNKDQDKRKLKNDEMTAEIMRLLPWFEQYDPEFAQQRQQRILEKYGDIFNGELFEELR